ncbi:hypothetical protein ACIBSW_18950 [Actinoplanes sp. NPDC049668]|uniref:hypothetical protein n=1 Tax=unclassified Actinoplanes TaxID=2626549 RepID=UPI0033A67466
MITIGVTILLGMILFATQLGVRAYLNAEGTSAVSPLVSTVVRNSSLFGVMYLLSGFAYVVAFFVWRHRTRELLRRVGDTAGDATRHWAIPLWTAALVASVVLNNAAGLGVDALRTAIRVLGICVLLFGVGSIREQVRRTIRESGVAFRMTDLPTLVPARAATPLPPAATPVSTAGLPSADDQFWDRVRRTAADAGTDLAMLETTDALARRWALIPTDGDLAPLRATLPPGALVTVFTEPPAATGAESFEPGTADEYHGFLEDPESGALWYQSVRPNRIPAFLARTRSARRWALYPAGSPAALSAVTPAAVSAT